MGFKSCLHSQVNRKEHGLPLMILVSGLLVYMFYLKFTDWIKYVNKLSLRWNVSASFKGQLQMNDGSNITFLLYDFGK